jgi:hypothetical protein
MTENDLNIRVSQLTLRVDNLNETVAKCTKGFEGFEKNINQFIAAANQIANIYIKKNKPKLDKNH